MPVEVLMERWFAQSYGWTPDQVAVLPLRVLDWFPMIERAQSIAEERRRQAENRK
jgi:hypothetical protein